MTTNNATTHPTKDTAMKTLPKTLPLLIHTVSGKTTLCGMDTSQGAPITRAQLTGRQWRTCPICELAATCAQLDAARTQRRRTIDTASSRWTQPTLFN